MIRTIPICLLLFLCITDSGAFTRQDTLRGSNGPGRSWWDVQQYDLFVSFDTARKSIDGANIMTLEVTHPPGDSLQIDLQDGMFLDSVTWNNRPLKIVKDGNVFWVTHSFRDWPVGSRQQLQLLYHGRPHEARNPPWDGGFIWTKDSLGNPWVAVACQGYGASSWWPCKDYQGDEPDSGMKLGFIIPGNMAVVSNGTLTALTPMQSASGAAGRYYGWTVKNPINTYNATFYLGNYVRWSDTIMGEKGKLDLQFYVLAQNEEKARRQFAVAKQMLHCYEHWLGPYPFYEDGYKLVEAPYLGMEHQSAVAYGNGFRMGYRGADRSNTGVGLRFDFIIVHESGHEWFGNNITAQDIADNWLHEGFTTYTEALFAECSMNRDSAFKYTRGQWGHIRNDVPVIGAYGVNDDGSGDKYDKGSAVVHMIRMMTGDDERFRQLLRGLNRDFYHQTVTSAAVEAYISKYLGQDLKPFFDQYLRTTMIPALEWYRSGKTLHYRLTDVVPGFELTMPVKGKSVGQLRLNAAWQEAKLGAADPVFSPDYLINVKTVPVP